MFEQNGMFSNISRTSFKKKKNCEPNDAKLLNPQHVLTKLIVICQILQMINHVPLYAGNDERSVC